jgi:hypothetical protein
LAKFFTHVFDSLKNINYESLFKTDWKKTLVSQKEKLVLWVGQLRRSEVAPVSISPTKKFKVTAAPQIEEVEEFKSSVEEEEVDLLEESDELLINDSEIDEPDEEFEEEESPFILEKEKKDDKFFESDEYRLDRCAIGRQVTAREFSKPKSDRVINTPFGRLTIQNFGLEMAQHGYALYWW